MNYNLVNATIIVYCTFALYSNFEECDESVCWMSCHVAPEHITVQRRATTPPATHVAEMSQPGKCVIHSTLLAEGCVHVGS